MSEPTAGQRKRALVKVSKFFAAIGTGALTLYVLAQLVGPERLPGICFVAALTVVIFCLIYSACMGEVRREDGEVHDHPDFR